MGGDGCGYWLEQYFCLAEANGKAKKVEASVNLFMMSWRSDSLWAMSAQSSVKSTSRTIFSMIQMVLPFSW